MSIYFCRTTIEPDGSTFIHTDDDDAVNLSNANAYALFAALGMEWDCVGTMDAADLAGRCLLALGMPAGEYNHVGNDPGTDAVLDAFGGACNVVSLPRREGYMEEKFSMLLTLAEKNKGSLIGWA